MLWLGFAQVSPREVQHATGHQLALDECVLHYLGVELALWWGLIQVKLPLFLAQEQIVLHEVVNVCDRLFRSERALKEHSVRELYAHICSSMVWGVHKFVKLLIPLVLELRVLLVVRQEPHGCNISSSDLHLFLGHVEFFKTFDFVLVDFEQEVLQVLLGCGSVDDFHLSVTHLSFECCFSLPLNLGYHIANLCWVILVFLAFCNWRFEAGFSGGDLKRLRCVKCFVWFN
jgi:hypothetical protein